jgi:hypothetical protein
MMKNMFLVFGTLFCVVCVSALNVSCEDLVVEDVDFEVPSGVPFSDEVLNFYIDDEFFGAVVLEDRKIVSVGCDVLEDFDYEVFVSGGLVDEVLNLSDGYVDFYNKKRANEELRIVASGFGGKLKMGFVNFGMRVGSHF